MPESDDLQSLLKDKLSARQCQILYWVCNDLQYPEISRKMNLSVSAIQAEMTKLYQIFDLDYLDRNKRRSKLYQTICPIFLDQVKDPGQCPDTLIEVPTPPDPKVLALVVRDAQEQNIPRERDIAPHLPGEILAPRMKEPPPRSPNALVYVLVGILGTLLVLAIAFIAFLIWGGGAEALNFLQKTPTQVVSERPVTVAGASATPAPSAVVTVLVPQPVTVVAPPAVATVIITQPAPTAITASPVIQTVVVTAPPPSPVAQTVIVTAPPLVSTVTPTSGILNVAGKVPSDIPGMNLDMGTTVYSVVSQNSKPRDVYAISLQAGRTLYLDISVDGCLALDLYNPGSASIGRQDYSDAYFWGACNSGWQGSFTPAISGTYYLAVNSRGDSNPYNLRVSQQK